MAKADDNKGFADMLAEYEKAAPRAGRARRPRPGEQVTGRVVNIGADSVFVDVGAKCEAVIDRAELTGADGELTVALGGTVTARVLTAHEGGIVLRTRAGRGVDTPSELEQARLCGLPVEGVVKEVNKGGVEVDVAGVRGFCAVSQLDSRYVEDPAAYVGRKLEFRITRYEDGPGGKPNLVLSRRALLEEQAARLASETRKRLEVGAVLSGTVTSIKDYGAFVDLGGLEGMLHISELGFGRVDHPSAVLAVGQAVEVQVLKIEPTSDPRHPERIGLSLKALQDDPWDEAVRSLGPGQELAGKVVRLEPFGAFVSLPQGIEGLVHVSEIGDKRIAHPREALAVGDEVRVCVLQIDTERRRVSLSIKAVAANAEAAQARAYRPASQASLGTFADLMKQKLKG
jgi:small subunit ribosomal protein S1